MSMSKRQLSEEDIKARYITPAVNDSGWDMEKIRFEYTFTDGRIIVRGNMSARGGKKRADYVLFYKKNIPIAVIEAKDNNHAVGAGLQQAVEYANALDVPYVYASNGDAFVEQNLLTGEVRNLSLDEFPSPEDLFSRFKKDKNISATEEEVMLEPYYYIPGYKEPRYYQRNAINRVVNAVDRKSTRLNSSHVAISYAVFCLKKKKK